MQLIFITVYPPLFLRTLDKFCQAHHNMTSIRHNLCTASIFFLLLLQDILQLRRTLRLSAEADQSAAACCQCAPDRPHLSFQVRSGVLPCGDRPPSLSQIPILTSLLGFDVVFVCLYVT
jgi:hypothetical protein